MVSGSASCDRAGVELTEVELTEELRVEDDELAEELRVELTVELRVEAEELRVLKVELNVVVVVVVVGAADVVDVVVVVVVVACLKIQNASLGSSLTSGELLASDEAEEVELWVELTEVLRVEVERLLVEELAVEEVERLLVEELAVEEVERLLLDEAELDLLFQKASAGSASSVSSSS